jgi:hypothetical protein
VDVARGSWPAAVLDGAQPGIRQHRARRTTRIIRGEVSIRLFDDRNNERLSPVLVFIHQHTGGPRARQRTLQLNNGFCFAPDFWHTLF